MPYLRKYRMIGDHTIRIRDYAWEDRVLDHRGKWLAYILKRATLDQQSGCWLWPWHTPVCVYLHGKVSTTVQARKLAFVVLRDQKLYGHEVHHAHDSPVASWCVNPDHATVTQSFGRSLHMILYASFDMALYVKFVKNCWTPYYNKFPTKQNIAHINISTADDQNDALIALSYRDDNPVDQELAKEFIEMFQNLMILV